MGSLIKLESQNSASIQPRTDLPNVESITYQAPTAPGSKSKQFRRPARQSPVRDRPPRRSPVGHRTPRRLRSVQHLRAVFPLKDHFTSLQKKRRTKRRGKEKHITAERLRAGNLGIDSTADRHTRLRKWMAKDVIVHAEVSKEGRHGRNNKL